MKKKNTLPSSPGGMYTSPLQTEATQTSEAQRGLANQNLGSATTGYGQFVPGSEGSSAYRRNLYAGLSSAANRAGENALARTRERAQAAGFGGNQQPITFGAEAGLANENANRMARIPLEVEQQAIPVEMQGLQGLTGIGTTQLGNAQQMFNQAGGMENQRLNEFYQQQAEARKRKAGIWGTLAKIGGSALGAIPGIGTVGRVGGAIGGAL